MRRRLIATALAVPVAAGLIVAGSAQAQTVQFQPEPCVITLAPQYTADMYGQMSAAIPDSAIQCPGFEYDSDTMPLAVFFTNAAGEKGANLGDKTKTVYDAATNSVKTTKFLELMGPGPIAGPFTGIDPVYMEGAFWLDSPTDNTKHYRLVLARPFDVVLSSAPSPSCTLGLASRYAYRWDQEKYFVIPDSAVRCTGFTFSSYAYGLNMSFSSKVLGAGAIYVDSRRVFNPSDGTYTTLKELRLTSYLAPGQSSFAREAGVARPAGSDGWTWGRFSQGPDGAVVMPVVSPPEQPITPTYRLTLAKTFAIKRATDVTTRTRRVGDSVRVSIHADRNWSFQNGDAQTHRRQTVLSASPADHALLKRNGKTMRRIALSPYGNATITLPAAARRRSYTVTMVETDDNFAGTARFKA